MHDTQEKITFDTNQCRTLRRGSTDLFDCLADKQGFICDYALPFGYVHFCKHPKRKEFAETPSRDKPGNPSQVHPLE